jgi:Uncharacterised protein family (UPF0183)
MMPPSLLVDLYPKACAICGSDSGCATGYDAVVTTHHSQFGYGSTCQDVLACLGSPSSVYARPVGKLAIHGVSLTDETVALSCCSRVQAVEAAKTVVSSSTRSSSESPDSEPPPNDYFYNYPMSGVDVLFDGAKHTVKKIVLHANFPACVVIQ